MMYIKWKKGFTDFEDAYSVRRQVFILEQNVPEDIEVDGFDSVAEHIVIYDAERPIATGRMFPKGDSVILGRICVLREYRGMDLGRILMERMLEKAEVMGPKEIKLDSQLYAIEFYRRFRFRERGGIFKDAGIDHIEMVRDRTSGKQEK